MPRPRLGAETQIDHHLWDPTSTEIGPTQGEIGHLWNEQVQNTKREAQFHSDQAIDHPILLQDVQLSGRPTR